MAKVDDPKFNHRGEVSCDDCPLDEVSIHQDVCGKWWNRSLVGLSSAILICPTIETYEEACEFAEKHKTLLTPTA